MHANLSIKRALRGKEMDHIMEKIWRAAYAEEVLKKSREYNAEGIPLPPNEVLGIYLDTEVLHVRIFMNGKTRPVISILNRSPSSRQLKKYKFFLPVEIYLLAVLCSLQVNFVFFHWC